MEVEEVHYVEEEREWNKKVEEERKEKKKKTCIFSFKCFIVQRGGRCGTKRKAGRKKYELYWSRWY